MDSVNTNGEDFVRVFYPRITFSNPCKHNWEPMIWEDSGLTDHKKVIKVYCKFCLETRELK